MQNPNIVFIGMDTHKEFTDVAYDYEGFDQKPYSIQRHGQWVRQTHALVN